MGSWIYVSSGQYGMHDIPRSAIEYSKDIKLRIISHLTATNFLNMISSQKHAYYFFGTFLGRNIDFVDDLDNIFNDPIRENNDFISGLAYGLCEDFPSFSVEKQQMILELANEYDLLADLLFSALGFS